MHKPVIISEFGAAAIYGHHTFDDIRWTEEYQARLFDHAIGLFHDMNNKGRCNLEYEDQDARYNTDHDRKNKIRQYLVPDACTNILLHFFNPFFGHKKLMCPLYYNFFP